MDGPLFTELLVAMTQSIKSAQEACDNTLIDFEHPEDGISLLVVKEDILLTYIQTLVVLMLVKLRSEAKSEEEAEDGDDTSDLDEPIRCKLVEMRHYLEKGVRPLEEKLRFSIDRFLRTAQDEERRKLHSATPSRRKKGENGESNSESEDDSDADDEEASDGGAPFNPGRRSAAPNLSTMVDDVTARTTQRDRDGGTPSGVYRPPRRERQVMESTSGKRDKNDRRPMRSRTMDEFVTSELSAAPLAEPSIGTTIVQGGRKVKTARDRQEEDERREYEEMHFTRLAPKSKKDKAKEAKASGRDSRMMFGGEEWHDLGEGVDRIDRLTKRKEGRGGVRALLDKSRKRGHDATDGPRGSGHAQMGERYQKKLKMLEGGRRDRGKQR